MAEQFKVEVCYALPQKQELVALNLPAGTTLQQAVEASGLLEKHGTKSSRDLDEKPEPKDG